MRHSTSQEMGQASANFFFLQRPLSLISIQVRNSFLNLIGSSRSLHKHNSSLQMAGQEFLTTLDLHFLCLFFFVNSTQPFFFLSFPFLFFPPFFLPPKKLGSFTHLDEILSQIDLQFSPPLEGRPILSQNSPP